MKDHHPWAQLIKTLWDIWLDKTKLARLNENLLDETQLNNKQNQQLPVRDRWQYKFFRINHLPLEILQLMLSTHFLHKTLYLWPYMTWIHSTLINTALKYMLKGPMIYTLCPIKLTVFLQWNTLKFHNKILNFQLLD